MAIEVSAFTSMARQEFAAAMASAYDKPFPAAYDSFTTKLSSTTKVDTHTYMTNLPRLARFKGYSPGIRLTNKEYTTQNEEYRAGPINVRKTDLDDDQVGGYMKSIQALPERARKDIGHLILSHLAAGTTNLCFDGTAFFAASHTFGSGDNLDTFNADASDGATTKIIALITDNPGVKPVLFTDREPLGTLDTDADTPAARKLKEFEYWSDCRFGLGYGFWWDAVHLTITDTPTVPEAFEIIKQIIDLFRTFTLPKGKDSDTVLKCHEGWEPTPANFKLLCSTTLRELLRAAMKKEFYTTGTGQENNIYMDIAEVIATSALD